MSEGDENYMFGNVTEVVDDGDGGVYAFDQQVPAIRHYDSGGKFVRTVGRSGSGPGEYGNAVLGLAVRSDGTLLAYDIQNKRINFYAKDGIPAGQWNVPSGLYASNALLVDSIGRAYVKILTSRDPSKPLRWPWPIGLVRVDTSGAIVDTISPPAFRNIATQSGPLATGEVWETTPDFTVIGLTSEYSFEIRRPDGRVVRASREYEPVAVGDAEWKAYEARRAWEIAHDPDDDPPAPTPRMKPVYRGFLFDNAGRIWVDRFMPGVPTEADTTSGGPDTPPPFPFEENVLYDVFGEDGTFYGGVKAPSRTRLKWIGSDHAWAITRGKDDEQFIVKLRLKK